jgi:hypothetical protein
MRIPLTGKIILAVHLMAFLEIWHAETGLGQDKIQREHVHPNYMARPANAVKTC